LLYDVDCIIMASPIVGVVVAHRTRLMMTVTGGLHRLPPVAGVYDTSAPYFFYNDNDNKDKDDDDDRNNNSNDDDDDDNNKQQRRSHYYNY